MMTDRVVALVDMDCFYCQVEAKLDPSLVGKPVAVVQYNMWKGGGIIAVNYEARDQGVSRGMRGDDARARCPDIHLVSVPTVRDKADLTKYRDASRDVIGVLCQYSECVERASIDEAYLDLTDSVSSKLQQAAEVRIIKNQLANTFVVGYSKEKYNDEGERESGLSDWLDDIYSDSLNDEASQRLAIAASIVENLRQQVFLDTGFRCSAGIAHNKILAKLACGLHKPNRQTVLPHSSVAHLYERLPLKKVRHLGGKLGDTVMEKLGCGVMADLIPFTEKQLQSHFDHKTGTWLYNMARGIDKEEVHARLVPKSIGCCKRFPGKTCLSTKQNVSYWLGQLTDELSDRILNDQIVNKRRGQLLTVSLTLAKHQHTTKSLTLSYPYSRDKIYNSAYTTIRKICSDPSEQNWSPIFCMGLSASKFTNLNTSGVIESFFKLGVSKTQGSDIKVDEPSLSNTGPVDSNKALLGSSTTNSFFFKYFTAKEESVQDQEGNAVSMPHDDSNKPESILEPDLSIKGISTDNSPLRDDYVSNAASDLSLQIENSNRDSTNNDSKTTKHHSAKKFVIKNSPVKSNEAESTKNPNSIEGFFKNVSGRESVNPLDVFPDLSAIDEDMLLSFPLSFRRKVLELKKDMEKYNNKAAPVSKEPCDDKASCNTLLESTVVSSITVSPDIVVNCEVQAEKSCESADWDSEDMFEERTGETSKYFCVITTEMCQECGEEVEKEALLEHKDFHLAQSLHRQINSVSVQTSQHVTTSVATTSKPNTVSPPATSVKRKQNSRSKKITDNKKFKSIKTFFAS